MLIKNLYDSSKNKFCGTKLPSSWMSYFIMIIATIID